jgi:DNA-binding NarL/FixJ family response regulator
MECIGIAQDGEEVIKKTSELLPDVIVMDINMPKMDGIDAAKRIKASHPKIAILLLSAYKYKHYVVDSIRSGFQGYLLKNTPHHDLISAIRMAHDGEVIFNSEAVQNVLQMLSETKDKDVNAILGSREIQVLRLVARGLTNKQIAKELDISIQTVGTHLSHVFKKINVETRTEATLYALNEGLVKMEDFYSRK